MQRLPILAGFECSTHRRADGRRLDLVHATSHEALALADFRLMRAIGIDTVREGLRWHVIEPELAVRDWSSARAIRAAAQAAGVRVIWDLLHFGMPDWCNPFHPDFPRRFADFAADAARQLGPGGCYVPVNEISFHAWGGGEEGFLHPWSRGRGAELKRALCAAALAATGAIRAADGAATIISVDPLIRVHPCADGSGADLAALLDAAQFEALDVLLGRMWPELGGHERAVDIIGVNHYPHSQWTSQREVIAWDGGGQVPLGDLLLDMHRRYGKPLLLSETGTEGDERADWFRHVVGECRRALAAGVDLRGLCLYPILNHPGWDDDRYCPNGAYCGLTVPREPHAPLVEAIRHHTGSELPGTDRAARRGRAAAQPPALTRA